LETGKQYVMIFTPHPIIWVIKSSRQRDRRAMWHLQRRRKMHTWF